MDLHPKLISNVCYWFKATRKGSPKSLVFNDPFELSGPNGIRAHIKAVKIIMEKFQRKSQRISRYTVHYIEIIYGCQFKLWKTPAVFLPTCIIWLLLIWVLGRNSIADCFRAIKLIQSLRYQLKASELIKSKSPCHDFSSLWEKIRFKIENDLAYFLGLASLLKWTPLLSLTPQVSLSTVFELAPLSCVSVSLLISLDSDQISEPLLSQLICPC